MVNDLFFRVLASFRKFILLSIIIIVLLFTYQQKIAGNPIYGMDNNKKLQSKIHKAVKKLEKCFSLSWQTLENVLERVGGPSLLVIILGFSNTIKDIIVPIVPNIATINKAITSI